MEEGGDTLALSMEMHCTNFIAENYCSIRLISCIQNHIEAGLKYSGLLYIGMEQLQRNFSTQEERRNIYC